MRAEIIFLLYFYYILFYFNTTLQWGIVKYQKFKFRQRDLSFTGSQVFRVKKLKTFRASDWRRFYHFLWDFVLVCPTLAVFSLAYKSMLVNSFALLRSLVMKRNVKIPRFCMLHGIRFSDVFFTITEQTKPYIFQTYLCRHCNKKTKMAKFQRKLVNPVVVWAPKNFHFFK